MSDMESPYGYFQAEKECRLQRQWREASYPVVIRNPAGLQTGNVELIVDGRPLEGDLVPAFADGRTHEVEATLYP